LSLYFIDGTCERVVKQVHKQHTRNGGHVAQKIPVPPLFYTVHIICLNKFTGTKYF